MLIKNFYKSDVTKKVFIPLCNTKEVQFTSATEIPFILILNILNQSDMFKDRKQAAKMLSEKLNKYKNASEAIIAAPKEGVIIGYELAEELNLPLDIILVEQIGHPFNRQFTAGSVSLSGVVIDEHIDMPVEYLEEEIMDAREILINRYKLYLPFRKPVSLKNKSVIITCDGIASGNTLFLTVIQLVRESNPDEIIVAVPVASPQITEKILESADEFIFLSAQEDFSEVSRYYEKSEQADDEDVIFLLKEANNSSENNYYNNSNRRGLYNISD